MRRLVVDRAYLNHGFSQSLSSLCQLRESSRRESHPPGGAGIDLAAFPAWDDHPRSICQGCPGNDSLPAVDKIYSGWQAYGLRSDCRARSLPASRQAGMQITRGIEWAP